MASNDDDEFEEDEIDWSAIPLHSISSFVTSHASVPALASNSVSNNGTPSRRHTSTATATEGVERHFRPSLSSGGIIDGVNSSSLVHRQQNNGGMSNGNQNQMGTGAVMPMESFPLVANDNNDVEALRRQVKMALVLFWFPKI